MAPSPRRAGILGPFDRWSFLLNIDYGIDENARNAAAGLGVKNATWRGVAGYARYKWTDTFEPSVRLEYYDDSDGFTTGVAQKLKGVTLSLNKKVGRSGGSAIMLRPEVRYDKSNQNFFSDRSTFRAKDSQVTVGVGATWFF